jgi:adenylate cyclase
MDGTRLQRRLAAVLIMDIASYSRLTATDEEGTHRRVLAVMSRIVEPNIAAAQGRVVKKTGDGVMVEFASVVEALRCAVEIQRATQQNEAALPLDQRIQFRMGIGLGDIIVEPDDIYGEGVNIAARLEAIADPGGIVLSEAAAQLSGHLGFELVDLGFKTLKNIAQPIRAYAVAMTPDGASTFASSTSQGGTPADSTVPGFGNRPAIAVLPFRHSGNEAEQLKFADGITEDLIVALARWRSFPVITRNSVFALKGRDLDLGTIGRKLGARYVVDGSIRRTGNRLRATTLLLDVETGRHISVEQYEYDVMDMFAIQDEIVRDILGALEPGLLTNEQERAIRVRPYDADAYVCYQSAVWHHYRYTKEDNLRAQELFGRALALDPDYVQAAANFAVCLVHAAQTGWSDTPREALRRALSLARHAVRTDSRHPMGHFASGAAYREVGALTQAIACYAEAIRLNPSYAAAHAGLAFCYAFLNRPHDALPHVELALRLSPHDPRRVLWIQALVYGHYLAGNYVKAAQEALAALPDVPPMVRFVVAALGQFGRSAEARALIPKLRELDGDLAGTMAYFKSNRFMVKAARDHIEAGLRKAGYGDAPGPDADPAPMKPTVVAASRASASAPS